MEKEIIQIDDIKYKREPAYFASMQGSEQRGFYWFDMNNIQIINMCYTELEFKEYLKTKKK